ncbi:DNA ligase 1 [Pteropus vampyrus]|uniref:DNA ligase n=1 Tax=Pteropus vampyrus TaxID=132908 RepID=A0A6P6BS29_PTEVA|nr:DNA ligase 1 [Pteropus vampyrus]
MQRSIMSFFYPKTEGKAKKPEEETPSSVGETEPPPKAALKERNGMVPESDSPVKRPGRKAARVLGSEGEEEDGARTPPWGQVGPGALPMCSGENYLVFTTASNGNPASQKYSVREKEERDLILKAEIPRAKAETPTESPPESERAEEKEAEEEDLPMVPPELPEACEAEPPAGSGAEPGAAVGQGLREEDRAKPLARGPKTLNSFFAPRKPAAKTEVREEGSGTPRKEAPEGPPEPSGYNPAQNSYHPVEDACWKQGQKVPYLAVARTFEKIEEVSARLRMVETLSNLLRSVVALSPSDLLPILYLSLNHLGPPQQGLELGVGDGVLLKAVAQATGRQLESVRAEAAEKGDVGLVAENSRSTQRLMLPPPTLTASGVFAKFRDIARLTGSASTAKKIEIIKGLFVACRHSEARFIARALSGRLRLGLAEQSVLAALAQAVSLTPPGQGFPPAVVDAGKGRTAEARKTWLEEQGMILKQTFCEVPDLDRVVPVLLEHGLERLPEHCRLSPGVPLKPMLAHPTRGVGEVLKRFEEAAFTCEYKYDGQRAQIHLLEGGEVKIFSRNQEDNTGKYPDIISRIPKIKLPSVTSFILDAEAVAWDREKKQIQPFQVLTTRKRKEVDAAEIQVQVCLYAFDLIYLNGESLVREPLSRRRQLLRENFMETEGEFVFATSLDTKDTDQIAEFLEQSVRDSCEGLMVKTLDVDATYEIAKRSHNWLKVTVPTGRPTEPSVQKSPLRGGGLQAPHFTPDECGSLSRPPPPRSRPRFLPWTRKLGSVEAVMTLVTGWAGGQGRGRRGAGAPPPRGTRSHPPGSPPPSTMVSMDTAWARPAPDRPPPPQLGTGFSDEALEEHHHRLQALVLPSPRSYVRADGAVAPDHWLEPSAVWEVKCADLSLSPIYPAARGLVDSEKGVSLRFPRFIRVREDKKPEEATTSAQVACLYRKQSQVQNQQGSHSESDPEDFY